MCSAASGSTTVESSCGASPWGEPERGISACTIRRSGVLREPVPGFVDFYRYQNIKEQLPEYQHRTLRIYDAADYALNLANVPFITYGGEKDKQLAASLIMQEEAGEFDVPVELIIGKNMGHKFDDISKEKFMAFLAEHRRKGRPAFPGRREIRFTTSTLRYNECEWLTLHELDQQYEPSTVESRLDERNVLRVTTDNVTALSIARGVADRVSIDGSAPVDLNAAADSNLPDVYFVRENDGWKVLDYDESLAFIENPEQNKRPGLQGPIDDAFMEPFVCVRGTGSAWSQPLQDWSTASLELFETEFDKWLRGKAPVIDDTQLTDELIAQKNLVLFGDPGLERCPRPRRREPADHVDEGPDRVRRSGVRSGNSCGRDDLPESAQPGAVRGDQLGTHNPREGLPGLELVAVPQAGGLRRHPLREG